MKLKIELIPQSLHGKSLCNLMPKEQWQQISRQTRDAAHWKCEICGRQPPPRDLHCHERWSWDDVNRVQKLMGFQALCKNCHNVKHWGFSMMSKTKAEMLRLGMHAMKVNLCTKKEWGQEILLAFSQFSERAGEWMVDFGDVMVRDKMNNAVRRCEACGELATYQQRVAESEWLHCNGTSLLVINNKMVCNGTG